MRGETGMPGSGDGCGGLGERATVVVARPGRGRGTIVELRWSSPEFVIVACGRGQGEVVTADPIAGGGLEWCEDARAASSNVQN